MSANAKIMDLHAKEPRQVTQVLPKLPRIARNLHEPAGWLSELAQIYRLARRGQLATEDASRLAFICSQAGRLAKDTEYLKYIAALGERFEELQARGVLPVYATDYASEDAAAEPDVVTP